MQLCFSLYQFTSVLFIKVFISANSLCSVAVASALAALTRSPSHPEAFAAILATDSRFFSNGRPCFGGITKGPRDTSTRRNSPTDMGSLYEARTALASRRLKALPNTTDAPNELSKLPQMPSNDHYSLRANMPKAGAPPTRKLRHNTVCFDLQGPFPPSTHGDNRWVAGFLILMGEERRIHLEFLREKADFPDHLELCLNTIDDPARMQLYTDNEYVLNSCRVAKILKDRQMAPMHNSCEYEPWQNPAEGPWKTLTAASRQFLLRGFGDDHPDSQAYWPTPTNRQRMWRMLSRASDASAA